MTTIVQTSPARATAIARLIGTTPRRMTTALVASIAAAILMAMVMFVGYASVQGTVQTVGKDAAPSVVAAEHIQALSADADASALNAVLTNDPATGPSWTQYRRDMNQAHDALITASQNITYGNEERGPILTLANSLSEYEYSMGQTLGKTPAAATGAFTTGHGLFQQDIRPASIALDHTNYAHLGQRYLAHRAAFGWQMALGWLSMLVLIGVLGAVQVFLFRHTHRLINPGFAAATGIALLLLVYMVVALNAGEAQLVAAKQNSFDSINALWSARAVAYGMNADESLYLLHNGNTAALTQDEADYTHYRQLMTAVDPQQAATDAQNGITFGGYLGDEMANITYPGERDAALAAIHAWTIYTGLDAQMRQLLAQGQYQQAMAIDLGTHAGQSDWAFAQFDSALGQVIAINQSHFDQQVRDAIGVLRPVPFVLGGALLAIILASVFGMKPRLEEYWL